MSEENWILLLYSLPSKSGTERVSVWRQLKKSGALPFKASAYLLPDRPELNERFQWLAQQVRDAGGEAALARVSEVEGMSREEIVDLFQNARDKDYAELTEPVQSLIARHRKRAVDTLLPELEKLRRQFEEIRKVDFFNCPRGQEIARLLERAAALCMPSGRVKTKPVAVLAAKNFAGKTWLTRPRPEIDRVGSAWLITRFIDGKARFIFAPDPAKHPGAIPYDMTGVEFTHHGEDCTFETLLKRFALKDRALRRLGEMIHDSDLGDGKFQTVEATGMDLVCKGWAKLGLDDAEILRRGFECFDALYEFLKSRR
jgi:hypothetical protein